MHGHVEAKFVNQYGEEKKIRKDGRGRWAIARERSTPIIVLTNLLGPLVGARIRAARNKRKLTQTELGERAGLVAFPVKHRIHDIEAGTRGGVRLGTLYALAMAMGVKPQDLLPSVEEVVNAAGVKFVSEEKLTVVGGNGT